VTDTPPQRFGLVTNVTTNAGAPEPTGVTFDRNPDGDSVDISWDAVVDPDLAEHRIFRTDTIGGSRELIAVVPAPGATYTDFAPPNETLLFYDVRAVYDYAGAREMSERQAGRQTPAPRILSPADGAAIAGTGPTRIIGKAQLGDTIRIWESFSSPTLIGETVTLESGLFWLDHDFGGAGTFEIWAEAVRPGHVVSVPSLESTVTISP
jgi:hypothetical protein